MSACTPVPAGIVASSALGIPVKAKTVWAVKEMFPAWSGALVTAGDVVFYGTMDGWFKALDARNGNLLWQFKVGSGIIAQPVSYKGPDGKQYVAVLSGVGGWAGAVVAGGINHSGWHGSAGIRERHDGSGQSTPPKAECFMCFRCLSLLFVRRRYRRSRANQPRTARLRRSRTILPFSNQAGEGFENGLPKCWLRDLGARLEYTWWAERKSFLKNSLEAGRAMW